VFPQRLAAPRSGTAGRPVAKAVEGDRKRRGRAAARARATREGSERKVADGYEANGFAEYERARISRRSAVERAIQALSLALSSKPTSTDFSSTDSPCIDFRRRRPASLPISFVGTATVVNDGCSSAASS